MIIQPAAAAPMTLHSAIMEAAPEDYVSRLVAGAVDLGLMEMVACPEEGVAFALTPEFVTFIGLNEMGIGIENGEWVYLQD